MKAAHQKAPACGSVPPVLVPPIGRTPFGKKAPAEGGGNGHRKFGGYNLLEELRKDWNATPVSDSARDEERFCAQLAGIEKAGADIQRSRKHRDSPAAAGKCFRVLSSWDGMDYEGKVEAVKKIAVHGGPASYMFLLDRLHAERMSLQIEMLKTLGEIKRHYMSGEGSETIEKAFVPLVAFIWARLDAATGAHSKEDKESICFGLASQIASARKLSPPSTREVDARSHQISREFARQRAAVSTLPKEIRKGFRCYELIEAAVKACQGTAADAQVAEAFLVLSRHYSPYHPEAGSLIGGAAIDLIRR